MCIRSWGSVRVYDYDGNSKTLTTWPEPLCRHRACSCFFVFDVIVSCQYRCTRKTRASSISCPHATVHRLLHVNHMSIEDMAKHVCQLCDVRVCVDQEKSRTCCGKDRIGQMFRLTKQLSSERRWSACRTRTMVRHHSVGQTVDWCYIV